MARAWGRTVRWGGLAALMVVVAGCQDPNRLRSLEASAVLSSTEFDFGEVPVGEWREGEVFIRNVGHVPFRPKEVLKLGQDGSFHAEVTDDALIYAGQERAVKLKFHPLREGPLQDQFQVQVDAEHPPEQPVTVKGKGTPTPIRIEPAVIDFETLEIQSDRELSFKVTNPVDLPLTIRITGDFVDPFSVSEVTVGPHETKELEARYAPAAEGLDAVALEVRACDDCTATRADAKGRAVKSAFEFQPAPVPFDEIPVHQTTRSKTRMRNITWRPVSVTQAFTTTDTSFRPLTDLTGRTLNPGEEAEVEIEFAARYSGAAVGRMDVAYTSNKARQADVVLDATGGRPQLAIAPVSIDFGNVAVGAKVERIVRLSNAGTKGDIVFQGVRGDGALANQFGVSAPFRGTQKYPWDPATQWPLVRQPAPGIAIAPGADYVDVRVYFEPTVAGDIQAQVTFLSDDMFQPERPVLVTGRGVETGPCTFEVRPAGELDFGNVPVGTGAVLGFYFRNTGPNTCAVKNIHLSKDAGGVFFMPGGALTGGEVPYDSAFSAMIAFRAPADGSYTGELAITVNDPNLPGGVFRLPLRGVAMQSCLTAAPPYIDFGPIRYDCSARPMTTYVSNQCSVPVTVEEGWIGEGTSRQFSVSNAPAFPLTLQPREGFEIEATYARNVHGQHYSPLFLRAAGELTPLMVPLLAETNHEGSVADRFVQGTDSQLDVLFVVSNTTTMAPYQDKLQAAIPGFIARARERGVDVRAGVTSTGLVERSAICGGGANGGEAGRLFPVDNSRSRVVSSASGSAVTTLSQNIDVGTCHNLVQGLETMRAALSTPLINRQDDPRTALPNDGNLGLIRSTARLAVVFLADEDDHSGFDPESYVQFLQTFKGPNMSHRAQAHAIVPTDSGCTTAGPPGNRFSDVARGTGGDVFNVCRSSYNDILEGLAIKAAGAQREFRLTQPVDTAFPITVRVGANTVGGWRYDAGRNSIVFEGEYVPASGTTVDVRYRSICGVVPN